METFSPSAAPVGQEGTWSGVVVVLILAFIVLLTLDACIIRSAIRTFYCIVILALGINMYLLWNAKLLAESGISPFGSKPSTVNIAHLRNDGMHILTSQYPNRLTTAPVAHVTDGYRAPTSASYKRTTATSGLGQRPNKESKQYHNVSNVNRNGKLKRKTHIPDKDDKKGVVARIKTPSKNVTRVDHKFNPFIKNSDVDLKHPFKRIKGKSTIIRRNIQNKNQSIMPSNLKVKKVPLSDTKSLQGRANNYQKKHQQNKPAKAPLPPNQRNIQTKLTLETKPKGKPSFVNSQHIKTKDITLGKEKKNAKIRRKRNINFKSPQDNLAMNKTMGNGMKSHHKNIKHKSPQVYLAINKTMGKGIKSQHMKSLR